MPLPDVQPSSSGIYSATYLENSPLTSAFFRLIVRGQGLGIRRRCIVRGGWDPVVIIP